MGIFDAHGISFPFAFFYARRIGGTKTALIREAHKYFSEGSSFFEKEALISKDRRAVVLHKDAALFVPTSQKSGKKRPPCALCSFIVLRVISVCFSDLICNYTVTYDGKYKYRLK